MINRVALALAASLVLFAQPVRASVPAANPFFVASTLPLQFPPFDRIRDEHYAPALTAGMQENRKEIIRIASDKADPTFENTIVAMERSGALLARVSSVFGNMIGANTNPTLEKLQSEFAPKFAAHADAILLDDALFARVEGLYQSRDALELDAESKHLVERYHRDFVRAGAKLAAADKEKLKKLNAQIAAAQTTFSQNVLQASNAGGVDVSSVDELKGLTDAELAAAKQTALAAKSTAPFRIALQNTSGQPLLAAIENRALRERLFKASVDRATAGANDNRDVVLTIVRLRAERAALLGYPHHAAYVLEDQTAKSVDVVNKLMADMAPSAAANAQGEAAAMQTIIDQGAVEKGKSDPSRGGFQLAGWDWAHYAEQVRSARYNFDATELRPYFELENVLQKGVFYAATQLYGITFKARQDLPVYHPDVRVFDVHDVDGKLLAIFLADLYARPSKRGGAWMNEYVSQNRLLGTHAVVANHLNIPKPPPDEPTLLTFDEANTLFHEFGHALHGMFSNVNYPRFAGTSVPTDFVEYPSQVNEMWMTWPSILRNYAVHYKTGEPISQTLVDKVESAAKFNQGFATVEYLASAMLDQAWHQMGTTQVPSDTLAFEASALKRIGLDLAAVPPRYRSTYFSHTFGGGYAAGYYSYLWSEVLDADSVEWFKENGGLSRKNGDHFRNTLLSRGGSAEALNLFRDFRGREPDVSPLLKRRGLDGTATAKAPDEHRAPR